MKIHDLVSSLEPVRSQFCDLGLNIVNGKADRVHADFVQVADVRVWYRMWLLVMKELNLRSWRYILQNQGDMVGFDIRNTHVACERLPRNDNGGYFLKSQHS